MPNHRGNPLGLGIGTGLDMALGKAGFTPLQLDPYAWYDTELGQPKNVGYVQLDGTSGDYIFTPDSSATSFSNDIEVVMRVKVTDWTAASAQTLVGKYVSTGNQRSWRFYVSAGVIGLSVSADGSSTVTTVSVTPTNALPDNTWIWLRMRLDLTNGSNSVGTLETAADAGDNIEPSSWTANGTNTGTTISGVFDSTAPTEIGSFAAGTLERLAGQVGRCIVRSGFSGTTVADFNASDCYGDGYWHSGGYQWTLGLPKVYDRSANNRAPATFGSGSNQPRWLPWTGSPGVYTPGTTSNYLSTAHAANMIPTTSLRVVTRVTLPSSTVTTANELVSKWASNWSAGLYSGSVIRYLYMDAVGDLQIVDDTLTIAARGVTPGRSFWLRYTHTLSGTVDLDINLSTSAVEPSSWTNVRSAAVAATASLGSGPQSSIGLMARSGGASGLCTGTMHYARVEVDGVSRIEFDAALCTQTGYTSSVGNVWTVYRSATGPKTAVQSPAANSARSVMLFGTDDYATVPHTAFEKVGPFTHVAVSRHWSTTNDNAIAAGKTTGALSVGWWMRRTVANTFQGLLDDGVSAQGAPTPASVAVGLRHVGSLFWNKGTNVQASVNTNAATSFTFTSSGPVVNSTDARIGMTTSGILPADMEFESFAVFDRLLTAAEVAQFCGYYKAGV